MFRFLLFVILLNYAAAGWSAEDPTFSRWLRELKEEAREKQISEEAVQATLGQAEYLPKVIELDRSQPEFISTFLNYLKRRVTEGRIDSGRNMLRKHQALLVSIENHYGVPKEVLVSFWGLETNYGKNKGDYGLASALMTLAYEGRRADFFRRELLNVMMIVDAGHHDAKGLHGSWAGAMGHMQFMPSTFLDYAVDADADGRNDIWGNLSDAFASAANYLAAVGWQTGEPIAIEVKLPENFEYYQAQLKLRQSSRHWRELGVETANGQALPVMANTAILLPQGAKGPAFLVGNNFDVVMKWNRSTNYALSVSQLAQQLTAGNKSPSHGLVYGLEVENEALTFDQAFALQTKLNALGFDSGKPDGIPGTMTRQAIRNYQLRHHIPADGYPSLSLYQKIISQ